MPEIKERPILFSAPMVRAILEGRKTVTRRVIKPQPVLSDRSGFSWKGYAYGIGSDDAGTAWNFSKTNCPFGKSGDRIWVREMHADIGPQITYRADLDDGAHCQVKRWKPAIHMFLHDSRILLEITDVRVERLQVHSCQERASSFVCPVGLEGLRGRE